jgi:AcrR family transcriptional regulator
MSEISAAVGGSKATVYNYFASKEELFVECMTSAADAYVKGMFGDLQDAKAEMPEALLGSLKNALRLICSSEQLASKRLLIAEAERSGIGRLFCRKMDAYMEELAAFLRSAMDKGLLRQGDPLLAARQLRALAEADIVERCLMGAHRVPPVAATVSRSAQNAVTTFFRAYAPVGGGAALLEGASLRSRERDF